MNESEFSEPPTTDGSNGCRPKVLLAVITVMLLVGVTAAGFVLSRRTTPGTQLVYELDDPSLAGHMVGPLTRRLSGLARRVSVNDAGEIEVLIASRDPAILGLCKSLMQSQGSLQFLVIANDVDHRLLLDRAIEQAGTQEPSEERGDVLERDELEGDVLERDVLERDVLERDVLERDVLERDVLGADGEIIGRWVTVAQLVDPKTGQPRLCANVIGSSLRDATTGQIVKLPAGISPDDAEVSIAQWMDQQSIQSLDVLTSVDPRYMVSGSDLQSVSVTVDGAGNPAIAMSLLPQGAQRMFVLTTENAPLGNRRRRLGIVFDDQLISAPNIISPIRSEAQVTGRFTRYEVEQIVQILRAGQLPVPMPKQPKRTSQVDVPAQLTDLF